MWGPLPAGRGWRPGRPSDEVAGGPVPRMYLPEIWPAPLAIVHRDRAARVEGASGRRPKRARHLAAQDDTFPVRLDRGVGDRHRREEGLRVRMERRLVERLAVGDLD